MGPGFKFIGGAATPALTAALRSNSFARQEESPMGVQDVSTGRPCLSKIQNGSQDDFRNMIIVQFSGLERRLN